MNFLDIIIIIILSYCLIMGLFRGLIREIAAIAGVFGGFYMGFTFYKEGAKFFSRWLSDPAYLKILGFLAIFTFIFIVVGLLGILVKDFVTAVFGEWFDKVTGALFGALKAILISSILLVALVSFLPKDTPLVRDSVLAPQVVKISIQLVDMIPKDVRQEFSEKLKQFKEAWKKKIEVSTPGVNNN